MTSDRSVPFVPFTRTLPSVTLRQVRNAVSSRPALLGLGAAALLAASALLVHRKVAKAEQKNPPRGNFLTVDGVQLHYLDQGEGDTLVLLHGNGSMSEDFVLSGVFDALARQYRVIAFDRPGFGHSTDRRTATGRRMRKPNCCSTPCNNSGSNDR